MEKLRLLQTSPLFAHFNPREPSNKEGFIFHSDSQLALFLNQKTLTTSSLCSNPVTAFNALF